MREENPGDVASNNEDIIDTALQDAGSSEGNGVQDENAGPGIHCEDDLNDAVADSDENDISDRRKYPRSEFTYPVEFRVFSRSSNSPAFKNTDQTNFNGYLKDISLTGAGLLFEDKYGRFDIIGMQNMRLKLTFKAPDGDRTSIFAEIRWIRKTDPKNFSVKIGIEFKDMEAWQSDAVGKLIGMRNKDHNMMWNLWELYENNRR